MVSGGAMNEAMDAIFEETDKLLNLDLSEGVQERLELMHFIVRYKFDLRTDENSDKNW